MANKILNTYKYYVNNVENIKDMMSKVSSHDVRIFTNHKDAEQKFKNIQHEFKEVWADREFWKREFLSLESKHKKLQQQVTILAMLSFSTALALLFAVILSKFMN